jgi:hypothetical protein
MCALCVCNLHFAPLQSSLQGPGRHEYGSAGHHHDPYTRRPMNAFSLPDDEHEYGNGDGNGSGSHAPDGYAPSLYTPSVLNGGDSPRGSVYPESNFGDGFLEDDGEC